MHSSIGTGTLAYAVGSKVMDVRTSSKCNDSKEATTTLGRSSQDATNTIETFSGQNNGYMDSSYRHKKWKSSNSVELYSARMSSGSAVRDSSCAAPLSLEYILSEKSETEFHEFQFAAERFYDFPSLPVTNLFKKDDEDGNGCVFHDDSLSVSERTFRFQDERMHSFQINNNVDLIMESNDPTAGLFRTNSHGTEFFSAYIKDQTRTPKETGYKNETVSKLRVSDASGGAKAEATTSIGSVAHDEKVSEWLWTLHRIGNGLLFTCHFENKNASMTLFLLS